MFFFSFGIKNVCQVNCMSGQLNVPRSLAFPTVMTMKKTLVVIKIIVKVRDPGNEVENEVISSEILNSETFFSQAFRKFSSFLLVFDLMHEVYVTTFLLVFHFLI